MGMGKREERELVVSHIACKNKRGETKTHYFMVVVHRGGELKPDDTRIRRQLRGERRCKGYYHGSKKGETRPRQGTTRKEGEIRLYKQSGRKRKRCTARGENAIGNKSKKKRDGNKYRTIKGE